MSEKALSRFEQPIATPGRRLLHHIPLKSVRKKVVGGTARAVNHEIPLIPFIDFLLCIVLFLLASFSASGQLPVDSTIRLPAAEHTLTMVEAPVVVITGSQLLVDGAAAGNTRTVADAGRVMQIPELFEFLTSRRKNWQEIMPGKPFPGQVVLQIDSKVEALVVKSVFQTAASAGYPRVSFMVGQLALSKE